MSCIVKGCEKNHRNLNEHYADMRKTEPLREGEKAIWHDEAFEAAGSKGVEPVNNVVVTKLKPRNVTNRAVNNAKVSVNNVSIKESVTNSDVNNAPTTTKGVINKKELGRLRAAKWRKDHREKYNSEMREVMQNIRAQAKFSHLENMAGDGI